MWMNDNFAYKKIIVIMDNYAINKSEKYIVEMCSMFSKILFITHNFSQQDPVEM